MRTIDISDKLDDCYRKLEEVKNMPEGEVCEKYNADSKSEIIAIIYEEIAALENYQTEYDDYDIWDDHGFANEADYVRWRYGA